MRWVFFAGEALTDVLVRRWRGCFGSRPEIVNLYGPTETTLVKCFHRVGQQPTAGIQPVGRPMPQSQALVLSAQGRLCGVGEPGEIVIRTPFGTRGYLNNEEENERRFRKNPFRDDPRDRLYYTGDRGRWSPNGELEFLGRLDDQVKIRGVRIEPGEVTAVLSRHPKIRQAFVTIGMDDREQPFLAAYAVPQDTTLSEAELRAYLSRELPTAAIPAAFVFLDALPVTPNGKVDRGALPPVPERESEPKNATVPPRNEVEMGLARIWGEVLRRDQLGIYDNFFHLGGNSLLAILVTNRLQDRFGVDLPLRLMFERPTIAELAKEILAVDESTGSG